MKGCELRKIRKKLHLTTRELGRLLYRSQTCVSHYENGYLRIPEKISERVEMLAEDAGISSALPLDYSDLKTTYNKEPNKNLIKQEDLLFFDNDEIYKHYSKDEIQEMIRQRIAYLCKHDEKAKKCIQMYRRQNEKSSDNLGI